MKDGYYTTAEAVHHTGASARQLQWWDEHGVLKPKQQGHSRLYTAEDLERARRILQMRAAHIPLQNIKRWLDKPWHTAIGIKEITIVNGVLVMPYGTANFKNAVGQRRRKEERTGKPVKQQKFHVKPGPKPGNGQGQLVREGHRRIEQEMVRGALAVESKRSSGEQEEIWLAVAQERAEGRMVNQ